MFCDTLDQFGRQVLVRKFHLPDLLQPGQAELGGNVQNSNYRLVASGSQLSNSWA